MSTSRVPSAAPTGSLIRITRDSEGFKNAKGFGQDMHRQDFINSKPRETEDNFTFYKDMFRAGGPPHVKVGDQVVSLQEEDLRTAFREQLKKELNLHDSVIDRMEFDHAQHSAPMRSIPTNSAFRSNMEAAEKSLPTYHADSRADEEDGSMWKFGKDAEGRTYLEIWEKISIRETIQEPNELGGTTSNSIDIPIPGYSITRYRCTQPEGGYEWLYTDVSNPLLERFFTADTFPPFPITNELRTEWTRLAAGEPSFPQIELERTRSRVRDGIMGALYGFGAGFVKGLQQSAALFSPVAFAAGIATPFAPPVGAVIALGYLALVALGSVAGAVYGAVKGALFGARNGWPKEVGHVARMQTLARHPFSNSDVAADLQQQQVSAQLRVDRPVRSVAAPQPAPGSRSSTVVTTERMQRGLQRNNRADIRRQAAAKADGAVASPAAATPTVATTPTGALVVEQPASAEPTASAPATPSGLSSVTSSESEPSSASSPRRATH
jgi:hypothetical protein